jgi:archaellum biogenesis ATPase FlaH
MSIIALKIPKERVSSCISGLDELLSGGYVKGRSTLLAGVAGIGKSILTWHFLFNGVKKEESGILFSLDQPSKMTQDYPISQEQNLPIQISLEYRFHLSYDISHVVHAERFLQECTCSCSKNSLALTFNKIRNDDNSYYRIDI